MADILAEQVRYYRERAPEYDDWWFRRGRYDRGPAERARWFAEVRAVEDALERFGPDGDVVELACGTGLWTQRLARRADSLTAIDASPEVIELNRRRTGAVGVEYVRADLFEWTPPRRWDVCFFGFWLSHVPAPHFERFWRTVGDALRPGGRVFFVDSARADNAAATRGVSVRRLVDGREFSIVKRIYDPPQLERAVARLGFELAVEATGEHFIVGQGVKTLT